MITPEGVCQCAPTASSSPHSGYVPGRTVSLLWVLDSSTENAVKLHFSLIFLLPDCRKFLLPWFWKYLSLTLDLECNFARSRTQTPSSNTRCPGNRVPSVSQRKNRSLRRPPFLPQNRPLPSFLTGTLRVSWTPCQLLYLAFPSTSFVPRETHPSFRCRLTATSIVELSLTSSKRFGSGRFAQVPAALPHLLVYPRVALSLHWSETQGPSPTRQHPSCGLAGMALPFLCHSLLVYRWGH